MASLTSQAGPIFRETETHKKVEPFETQSFEMWKRRLLVTSAFGHLPKSNYVGPGSVFKWLTVYLCRQYRHMGKIRVLKVFFFFFLTSTIQGYVVQNLCNLLLFTAARILTGYSFTEAGGICPSSSLNPQL